MKNLAKRLILQTPFEGFVRKILRKPSTEFVDSGNYWEQRYQANGNSGAGSYGRLAEFKAEVLNDFVRKQQINSVIEYGCGDGNQLTLANYPSYIGVDVSPQAIALCTERFKPDGSKSFLLSGESEGQKAELALSLDVIYHLVEDLTFERYMEELFRTGTRHVVIYSSNHSDNSSTRVKHVRHRRFTDWVTENATEFELINHLPNKYPYDATNPDQTRFADFYFFARKV